MIGAVIDISARKRVEAALRISESKYANALKMVGAGGWEYDVLADRLIFNDAYYHVFRTTAEAVGGYTMSSADFVQRFVHPDDRESVGAEIKAAIETNDPDFSRTIEHRTLYGDGTSGYIAVRLFIVKDEAGRPSSPMASLRTSPTEGGRNEIVICRGSRKKILIPCCASRPTAPSLSPT